jgi:hypothetical protein
MLQDHGVLYGKMLIDLDGGNGLRMISGKPGEVWTGRVDRTAPGLDRQAG